jgi:hypothetical protein
MGGFTTPIGIPTAIADYLTPYRDIIVTSNVDYVDLLDLDINTHKAYLLIFTVKNSSTSDCQYKVYVNGNYTSTNYYSQYLYGGGSTTGASRLNDAIIEWISAGERSFVVVYIAKDPDGYFKCIVIESGLTGSSVAIAIRSISSTFTVYNITSIRISASASGGIGAGSRIMLFRLGG